LLAYVYATVAALNIWRQVFKLLIYVVPNYFLKLNLE
jgi:hypothetical protein